MTTLEIVLMCVCAVLLVCAATWKARLDVLEEFLDGARIMVTVDGHCTMVKDYDESCDITVEKGD